jgi:hypothetical protein
MARRPVRAIDARAAFGDDAGAVLVHVATGLLALIAFTTFVVDYGVFALARRQAQNAADSGALAAAFAYAFEGSATPSGAQAAGFTLAQANRVFGEAPAVNPFADVVISTSCPPGAGDGPCARVDVYRDTAHGNPLPMFFGPLVGLTKQDVKATATARIADANAVRCALPWAVADRWAEPSWTMASVYEPPGDVYKAPYTPDRTGWTTALDYGSQLIVHMPTAGLRAGWAGAIGPTLSLGEKISGCDETLVVIAQESETCASAGTMTPVEQARAGCRVIGSWQPYLAWPAVAELVQQDSFARWDPTVQVGPPGSPPGGVVDNTGSINMSSPRIRPLPVFDLNSYMTSCSPSSLTCVVKIVNVIGFFVEGTCDTVVATDCDPAIPLTDQIVGRIVHLPGSIVAPAGMPVHESSFVKSIVLVR